MTLSFGDACEVVRKELGDVKTETVGYEDDDDFNVLVVPPLMDQVVLVNKESGEIHKEIYFDIAPRLERMSVVRADGLAFDPGERVE